MTRNNKNKKSDAGKVTVKGNGKFDKNGKLISVSKKNNNKPKTENKPKKHGMKVEDFLNQIHEAGLFTKKIRDGYYHVRADEKKNDITVLINVKRDGSIAKYKKNPEKDKTGWVVDYHIKSKKQMETTITKLIEAKKIFEIRSEALTPIFRHGDFETTNRQEMIEHLEGLLN